MPRSSLIRLVKVMFGLLALGFAFVLFRSLSGPSLSSAVLNPFDDVQLGETALRRHQSERVWVTRLTPEIRRQLTDLDGFVELSPDSCKATNTLCVIPAATSISGVDIRYSTKAPARFPNGVPWFGGFVDPSNGTVFDRIGRAYKNQTQTEGLEQIRITEPL